MRLANVADQHVAIGTLRRAIDAQRVPHAYLFDGPEGVGKKSTARAWAAALNCESRSGDACENCESCRKISQDVHPDVRVLGLPEGKARIPIELVREAERWLALPPHEGRAKVLILDPADQMSAAAANALLKTLEEPRAGSYLVLVTAAASSLLPTVRSRCHRLAFRPLSEETVDRLLRERGRDEETARMLAALSGGSMKRAAQYEDENLSGRLDAVLDLIEAATARTPERALAVAAGLRGNRLESVAVLDLVLMVLGRLLWASTGGEPEKSDEVLSRRLGERYEKLARASETTRITVCMAAFDRALAGIRRNNANPQLAVEGALTAVRGRPPLAERWGRIGIDR